MIFALKLVKLISGALSAVLSVLLLLYLGIKDENWTVLSSDGQVVVNKTMGMCLIVVWMVVGAVFLLFDHLYRRSRKKQSVAKEKK